MNDAVEKILLLPRFTSFAGSGPFYTAPMNVRAYRKAILDAWSGQGIGADTSTATITAEESTDLGVWTDVVTSDDGIGVDFSMEWMRLKIVLTGANPANTVWAVGNFVLREE